MKPGVRLWARIGSIDKSDQETQFDQAAVVESVRDNINWIFNTHRGDSAACKSFGLPDISAVIAGLPKLENEFCTELEKAIREHEPRISWVRVRLFNTGTGANINFHFVVEAVLNSDEDKGRRELRAVVDLDGVFSMR